MDSWEMVNAKNLPDAPEDKYVVQIGAADRSSYSDQKSPSADLEEEASAACPPAPSRSESSPETSPRRVTFELPCAYWPGPCLDELDDVEEFGGAEFVQLDLCFHFLPHSSSSSSSSSTSAAAGNAGAPAAATRVPPCVRFPPNVRHYGIFDAQTNGLPKFKSFGDTKRGPLSPFSQCRVLEPASGQRFAPNRLHTWLHSTSGPTASSGSSGSSVSSSSSSSSTTSSSGSVWHSQHLKSRQPPTIELPSCICSSPESPSTRSPWTALAWRTTKQAPTAPHAAPTLFSFYSVFSVSQPLPRANRNTGTGGSGGGGSAGGSGGSGGGPVGTADPKLFGQWNVLVIGDAALFHSIRQAATTASEASLQLSRERGVEPINGSARQLEALRVVLHEAAAQGRQDPVSPPSGRPKQNEQTWSHCVARGACTAWDVVTLLEAQMVLHTKLNRALGPVESSNKTLNHRQFGLRRTPRSLALCALEASLPMDYYRCRSQQRQRHHSSNSRPEQEPQGTDRESPNPAPKSISRATEAEAEAYFRSCDRHDLSDKLAVFHEFQKRGGQVVFLDEDCGLDDTDGDDKHTVTFNAGKAALARKTFHLRPTDIVYPVCHEGQNRSQVLRLVVDGVMRQLGAPPEHVQSPHGASGGFDPYQAYADLTEDNFFGYIQGHIDPLSDNPHPEADDWSHAAFWKAFGQAKSARLGARVAGMQVTSYEDGENDHHHHHHRADPDRLELNPDVSQPMTPEALDKVALNRRFMRAFWEHTVYSSDTCAVARLRSYLLDGTAASTTTTGAGGGGGGGAGSDENGDGASSSSSGGASASGTSNKHDGSVAAGEAGLLDSQLCDAHSPRPDAGRRVFITFCRATAIIMRRLLEACCRTMTTTIDGKAGQLLAPSNALCDVVIVALPFSDPIGNAGCREKVDAKNAFLVSQGLPATATRDSLTTEMYLSLYHRYSRIFPIASDLVLRDPSPSLQRRLHQRAMRLLRNRQRRAGHKDALTLSSMEGRSLLEAPALFLERELERVQLSAVAFEPPESSAPRDSLAAGRPGTLCEKGKMEAKDETAAPVAESWVPVKNLGRIFPAVFARARFQRELAAGVYIPWRDCIGGMSVVPYFKEHRRPLCRQLVALVATLHQRGVVLSALALDTLYFNTKEPAQLVYYSADTPMQTAVSLQAECALPGGPLLLVQSQLNVRHRSYERRRDFSPRAASRYSPTASPSKGKTAFQSEKHPKGLRAWFLHPSSDILALGQILRLVFTDAKLTTSLKQIINRMMSPNPRDRPTAQELSEQGHQLFESWVPPAPHRQQALPPQMSHVKHVGLEIVSLINEMSAQEQLHQGHSNGVKARLVKTLKIPTKASAEAVNNFLQLAAHIGLITGELQHTALLARPNQDDAEAGSELGSRKGRHRRRLSSSTESLKWTCRVCQEDMVDGEGTCNLCGMRKPHVAAAGSLGNAAPIAGPGSGAATKFDSNHRKAASPSEEDDDAEEVDPLAHPASQRLIISIDSHIEAGIAHLQSTVEVVSRNDEMAYCLFLLKFSLFKKALAERLLAAGVTDRALQVFKAGHVWASSLHLNCSRSEQLQLVFATEAAELLGDLHRAYVRLCPCRRLARERRNEAAGQSTSLGHGEGGVVILPAVGSTNEDGIPASEGSEDRSQWCTFCRTAPEYSPHPVNLARSLGPTRRPSGRGKRPMSRSSLF